MASLSDISDAQAATLLTTMAGVNYYAGLHTADPGGTGASEIVSGGAQTNGYARQLFQFSGPTSRVLSSDRALAIPLASNMAANQTFPYVGVWSAATNGTFIARIASGTNELEATYDSATGVWETKAVHSLVADNRVVIFDATGATVPGGLTQGTSYYLRSVPTTHTFTLSTDGSGGSNTLLSGGADGGAIVKQVSLTLYQASNIVNVGAGNLTLEL